MSKDKDTNKDNSQNSSDKTDEKRVEYVVAPGRSICGTLKGVMDAGRVITSKCLRGDAEAVFRDLVERGDIVTRADYKKVMKLQEAATK